MKVLIIHTSYKYKGGEDTVVDEEMELLKANGVTVDLLQFTNNSNTLIKLLQLPFNFRSYIATGKKLKAYEPDVVHIHNLHFAASASVIYAIKKSKVPFVMTLHNYRLLCPSATLSSNGKLFLDSIKQNFPWKAVSKGLYKNSRLLTFWLSLGTKLHQYLGTWNICKRYIVLSQHSKNLFLESGLKFSNDSLIIKPNFCSVPEITRTKSDDYFLYVGRLIDEKGVRLLLKVFSASGYKIKIAGDGPLRDEVINYSSEYDNIEYLGLLNKKDVFYLLNLCTALLFPSTWFEGMPLTIIEAFACGVPVIASKLGAMESMITDNCNGLHFEPGNEEDLKVKIQKWQSLKEVEKEAYRKNARTTYDQLYTPKNNFKQLNAIYTSVISEQEKVI